MSLTPSAAQPARSQPFLPLLYRYFWPFACFRDVTQGRRLERQINYRHNRQMRVHLPGFALKWALLTLLLSGMGLVLASLAPDVLIAFIFASAVSTFSVSVVAMTAWCWLTRFPELY